MEKIIEEFIKNMDEVIEETLTDEFADYGDTDGAMDDMISIFLAFKNKMKSKQV